MRWNVLGILCRLASVHFTLTCNQKESLLELPSSGWPQIALSLDYTAPACNWCTFGFLDLNGACFFLVTKTGEVSKLVASFPLVLFSRILKSFHMSWITTLGTFIFVLVGTLDIKSPLVLALHLEAFTSMLFVTWLSGFCSWFLFLLFPCW